MLALLAAAALGACAGQRPRPPAAQPQTGAEIAGYAAALVGTPYRFGGSDGEGFDCSGLAVYVYGRAGVAIPRTAAEQKRAALAVPAGALQPGDLVFFRIRSQAIDHVGVYSGAGRFVHAPRAGQAVAYADLGAGYYAQRYAGAGRFLRASPR